MIRERDYQIDNIRAFAILLVMFGHSIILYSDDWNLYTSLCTVPFLSIIKKYIDIVQMPLFFCLSGLLNHSSYKKRHCSTWGGADSKQI